MKYSFIIITWLLFSLSGYGSEEMEADFLDRFKQFMQDGKFKRENLNQIWMYEDTPHPLFQETVSSLRAIKENKFGETTFHEITPAIIEELEEPFKLGVARRFRPNLTPLTIFEIKLQNRIRKGHTFVLESELSYVLGESEGRLFMIGLKEGFLEVSQDDLNDLGFDWHLNTNEQHKSKKSE